MAALEATVALARLVAYAASAATVTEPFVDSLRSSARRGVDHWSGKTHNLRHKVGTKSGVAMSWHTH